MKTVDNICVSLIKPTINIVFKMVVKLWVSIVEDLLDIIDGRLVWQRDEDIPSAVVHEVVIPGHDDDAKRIMMMMMMMNTKTMLLMMMMSTCLYCMKVWIYLLFSLGMSMLNLSGCSLLLAWPRDDIEVVFSQGKKGRLVIIE